MTDLVYIPQGLFTAFIPETKAGEDAFRATQTFTMLLQFAMMLQKQLQS